MKLKKPRPRESKIQPQYDKGGLLKGVKAKLRGAAQSTDFITNITYNSKGQRDRIRYGNGSTTKYEYDEKTFRLKKLFTTRNNGTNVLQDLNYKYDPVGNITEIKDDAQEVVFFDNQMVSPSQTFKYDALYRLTEATGREHINNNANTGIEVDGYPNVNSPIPSDSTALRNYTRKWEYDDVGNILQMIHTANNGNWNRLYNYASDNNRLISTTVGNEAVNYLYNAHGSMTKMPHLQAMEWDFAERLSHVTKGTGAAATEAFYNYDNSGERVRKVVEKNNGNIIETRLYLGGFEIYRKKVGNVLELERETLHIMDGGKPVTAEKDERDAESDQKRIALVETKTWENDIAVVNPVPVLRYQFDNHLGSAALELDEFANIISYEEYYPYGDTSYQAGRSISEVNQKRYRYTSKEKDEESGLSYHSARYYASWLGRWTAADPAGLVDGPNLYVYCGGNPIVRTDSTGTVFKKIGKAIGGAAKAVGGAVVSAAKVVCGGVVGAIAGGVVGAVGGAIAGAAVGLAKGVIGGAIVGFVAGGPLGMIAGAAVGAVGGVVAGAVTGAVIGGITGAIAGGITGAAVVASGKSIAEAAIQSARLVGGAAITITGAAIFAASLPFSFIPGSGFITQLGASMLFYGGFMTASVFSKQIRDDMDAIGWNPFNRDESEVVGSRRVSFYKGVPVIRISGTKSASFGALWLGSADEDLVRHEWGHSVQFMLLGLPFYTGLVAIPSVISILTSPEKHHEKWFEKWADRLGGANR